MLVAFPGLILALFVAVVFGVGAAGAVVALGVAGAPALARLTHTLASSVGRNRLRRRRPRARRRATPPAAPATSCRTSPSRSCSTSRPRSARPCSPSRRCRSSASACNRRSTTGAGCSTRGSAGSTSTRLERWRRGRRSSSPGLTFNLLGEGLAQVASGRHEVVPPARAALASPAHRRRRRGGCR